MVVCYVIPYLQRFMFSYLNEGSYININLFINSINVTSNTIPNLEIIELLVALFCFVTAAVELYLANKKTKIDYFFDINLLPCYIT